MSKRKKLRTSGEGVRPSKPPKNPRLGDSDGGPQSSKSGHLRHLEESEGKPGPASSTQHSREEPGRAVSSSPDEETGAPCRLLGPPEKEPPALPPSQNSVGRFVPQFSNPRKTVARKADTREEDLGSGAFSLLFPAGSRLGPCWPGPNPCSKGDPIEVAKAQPSRLIMSAHRDLEAFKRLSYRKAKPAGKASLPYSSKGPGNVPRGEQPWRDL
ncbi:break repair meiotic recombinase recruitment factor 1 isoform X3 [Eulemur rufifrons]|uniref:break repair meiotic recombinase recruitment factor 1 isoform X3 n=1 Tax=Eulemur rufifrons TaxID=859984 RepID=UPI003742F4D6